MSHTLTISGKPYTVEPRYAEGHVLNANEASALNQTFFENLRNNFANKAKEGADQAAFDEYASSYQFGVRTGGGSRDPVETEAMNLARDAIKDLIKKQGKNISDYPAKAISEAAAKLLDRDPSYRELAKRRVEEMQSAASASVDTDDLFASLETAAAEAPEAGEGTAEAAPSRRRKAEAAE
jgi:hypothetical protein